MTRLLLNASVQHMRLTMEELPIGSICVTKHGVIDSVDHFTESQLEFSASSLRGASLTILFGDQAFDFLECLRKQEIGFVWRTSVRTRSGQPLSAVLVLAQSLQPHLFAYAVFYQSCAESLVVYGEEG